MAKKVIIAPINSAIAVSLIMKNKMRLVSLKLLIDNNSVAKTCVENPKSKKI